MKRRQFLHTVAGAGTMLILPVNLNAFAGLDSRKLKFGVCADVHKDIMHDANERLQTFVEKAGKRDLDFIIQLGDFCRPYEHNRSFLNIWESYEGSRYHVIGNHDMDGGFSRKEVIKFWNCNERYYSFDSGGFHIIVLNGNDKNRSKNRAAGYARYIGKKQIKWLKNDLKATQLPCLVFSHQTLENNDDGIENREEIRELFETENREADNTKVIACFSGHSHTDYVTRINGIYYIQINSMSYGWLGEKCQVLRYSKEINAKYPFIKYTVPFRKPLYTFINIDNESIKIEGLKTEFVGPSPEEKECPDRPENKRIVPFIEDRELRLQDI